MPETRLEKDTLGEVAVPSDALYGAQTQRAVEAYPISGLRPHPRLIEAYLCQKKASALANVENGDLDREAGDAIVAACDEALEGRWRDHFVVDPYSSGAGVSIHMNVNEVLANRANEILGGARGAYRPVHPNDHVNRSQSTNDTFPTAMRLAALLMLPGLDGALGSLQSALERKGAELDGVLKAGRTHLQDAAPVRLGQEMAAYAAAIARGRRLVSGAAREAREIGLGGTAVGTGLNASPAYRTAAIHYLNGLVRDRLMGIELAGAADLREALQSQLPMAALAAALKATAMEILRITNDLRLLASGPTAGLAEIRLPAIHPGSSIMPGKVNPAVPEMMAMVCMRVVGAEASIAMAVQAGQLELNVMMPLIAQETCSAIDLLTSGAEVLAVRCVAGIEADAERCRRYAESSPGVAAALNPLLGYAAGADIAKEAIAKGMTIVEIVREKSLLTDDQLGSILDPLKLTDPGPARKE